MNGRGGTLRTRDLDGVMGLYSGQCNDHGSNLFDEFQELTNVHHSSRLGKVTSGSKTIIEVTCAGSLSGLSKTGGLRVPIDS